MTIPYFSLIYIILMIKWVDGVSDLEKLTSTKYFIDKSNLLATVYDDQIPSYHYITYPNGFGKSINLQLVKLFSNIEVDDHNHPVNYSHTHAYHLFQKFKIFKHHDIVKKHLAQHPVLHLTFHKIHNITEEFILGYLNDCLRACFEDYEWLLKVPKEELINKKKHRNKYILGSIEISFLEDLYYQRLTMADAVKGLRTLSKILTVYFGKRVVLLIDQYDHVLGSTLTEWDHTTKYVYNKINAMIAHALESHNFVQRALIFGTNTAVPFRETHSVLNRMRHHSFLTENIFDDFFGFNEHDMSKLYSAFKCSTEEIHGIREYYNGYKILDSHRSLFNPRSVMMYLMNKHGNKTSFRKYWKEENRFLEPILKVESTRSILTQLVQDIPVKFTKLEVYSELDYLKYRENRLVDLIMTMLFDRGYLTPTRNDEGFILPNVEIKLDIENELEYLGFKLDSKWTRTRPQFTTSATLEKSVVNNTQPGNSNSQPVANSTTKV